MGVLRVVDTPKALPAHGRESFGACPGEGRGQVVGDCHEIADDLVADVGPALDHLFGGRPILVADLAGSEDMAAAPPAPHVLATLIEMGVLRARIVRVTTVGDRQFGGTGGDVAAATPLRVAEQDEQAAGDVDVCGPHSLWAFLRIGR
jgi:hypothetical protein